MKRRPVVAIVLAVGVLALSGCAGVPGSSAPEAVQQINIGPVNAEPSVAPQRGADPRLIVTQFLDANATSDPQHTAARQFLSPEARSRWVDSTVTIVDSPQVSLPHKNKVTVTGNEIGTIDATGAYTPALRGDGTGNGGTSLSSAFGMTRIRGQWRIDSLQSGLLISDAQFQEYYSQRAIYFYDIGETHLVPDPRYSQALDPPELANWLIARLSAGPRDTAQNAQTSELPAQTDPKRVTVTVAVAFSGTTRIQVPGAAHLDGQTRNRLAREVATTLAQVPQIGSSGEMQISDGAQPVLIPDQHATQFNENAVAGPEDVTPPSLYYLRDGGVLDESGARLSGRVGNGAYSLTSVALADRGGNDGLQVAGTLGSASDGQLDVGTVRQGLRATTVHGRLSRPDWAPDVDEVWIGDGPRLYRVGLDGKPHLVPVTTAGGKASGDVTAVRLSPEGSRLAIVLTAASGQSQLFVGTVVRVSGKVRVDSLTPISPQGITVTDVAWNGGLKLFAIGHDASTGDPGVYEVQSDGSLWTPRGIGNLLLPPDSITVAENVVAAVSTGDTVWKQRAFTPTLQPGSATDAWVALAGADQTRGTQPIYVE